MKYTLCILFAFSFLISSSQPAESENRPLLFVQSEFGFTITMNLDGATKDGIWLNGYLVNIPYRRAKKLDGKTIEVTGDVSIKKSRNTPPMENEYGEKKLRQGRSVEVPYIKHPKIRVIED